MDKRQLFIGTIGLGTGIGIGLCIAVFALQGHASRKPAWNENALRVKHVRGEGLTKLDQQLKDVSVGSTFEIDIENTTNDDIDLPASVKVMQTAKETGALHGSLLTLPHAYFLPAGQTATIHLDNDELCAAKVNTKQCFNNYFADQKDIVIFDSDGKYEIHATIPPFSDPVRTGGLPTQLN